NRDTVERLLRENDAEQSRFRGTRVTVASFLEWKARFDQELLEKEEAARGSAIIKREEAKKQKPTGRQLFEQDETLTRSDMTFVEEGDVAVDNKLAAEITEKETEAENVTNGIIAEENDSDEKDDDRKTCEDYRDESDTKEDTATNSEISHKNILIDSITSKDNIPSTTSKSDSKLSSPISSPTFSSTSSSFNSSSDQSSTTPNPTSPKNFTSAPIPTNIRKDGDRNGKENGIVNEFADGRLKLGWKKIIDVDYLVVGKQNSDE
ncbi:26179_t:CDS:2, partial [Gigaspora rosea]